MVKSNELINPQFYKWIGFYVLLLRCMTS